MLFDRCCPPLGAFQKVEPKDHSYQVEREKPRPGTETPFSSVKPRVRKDPRCQFGNLKVSRPRVETLEWWRRYMEAFSKKLRERPALSATAAMNACTDEWESLASKLCARCRGTAASALVLAHTYLEEMIKVEIEEEVQYEHYISHMESSMFPR